MKKLELAKINNKPNKKPIDFGVKNLLSLFSLLPLLFILSACEGEKIDSYIPQYYVEAYLIVDQPINSLKVMKSIPIKDSMDYKLSLRLGAEAIVEAKIILMDSIDQNKIEKEFTLVKNTEFNLYTNEEHFVKSKRTYKLEIKIKDINNPNNISTITGTTTTPSRTSWVREADQILDFPVDSLNARPTDTLEWAKIPETGFFIVSVSALDTSNYGKYFENYPNPKEKNRRIVRTWKEDRIYKETNTVGVIPNTKTPAVWASFNWYGKHEIAVFAPDYSMLRWFLQARTSREYNPLFNSVDGAIGCFGSATVIRDTFLLKKNQP